MAVPYTFRDVFIQIFDVNAIPDFLRGPLPAIKAVPFGFLALKGEYEKRQASDQTYNSNNFVVQRFPKNKLKESEFWLRYSDVYPSSKLPYWDRQIPFYLRLRKHILSLSPEMKLDPAKYTLDSYVTLSALGWSTHLEIRVQSDCSIEDLAQIVANLRSKTFAAYNLNNVPMTLRDIFGYYKDQVLKDGFSPHMISNQPDNFWHIVNVDVINATGDDTSLLRWMGIDLEDLLKVTFPNHAPVVYQVNGPDRTPRSQNNSLLFTHVDDEYHNFSISDFNAGFLTFLQSDALVKGKETRMMCYSHNVNECMWMCYLWFQYFRLVDPAKANARAKSLLATGTDALKNLSRTFNNCTCQGMFKNHKDMPKLP